MYQTSGVMFIRSQNVTFDGLKLEDIAFIDFKTHEAMRRSEVFANDVLLNITGPSIGRCSLFLKDWGQLMLISMYARFDCHPLAGKMPSIFHLYWLLTLDNTRSTCSMQVEIERG